MVATTQTEMKKLLSQQYGVAVTKSLVSLLLAFGLTIGIPLGFRSVKNDVDKLVNGLGFCGSCLFSIYAYINSYSVKELGGKLKMFTQLEKERFIREQLISQQVYLEQVNQHYYPPTIQEEIYCENPSQIIPVSHEDIQETLLESDGINHETSQCPHCGSPNINKNGLSNGVQRYKCKNCNKSFGG